MNINSFFTVEKIAEFKTKYPLFPHPYEYLYQDFKPLEGAISKVNNHLLHQRICDLSGTDEVTKFYGLISELKVALLIHKNGFKFECSKEGGNTKAAPDFKVITEFGEIYIEVNAPLKSMPYISSIERKFKDTSRTWFNITDRLPKINNYSDAEIVFNSILFAIQNSDQNFVFYEDEERSIKFWYNEPRNIYSGFSKDKITNLIRHFLYESITDKIDKEKTTEEKIILRNNLNNSHPNILWSEFNFLHNFQGAIVELTSVSSSRTSLSEIFSAHSLPKDIDAQIISISNLTDSYQSAATTYFPLFYIFINKNSKNFKNIKAFIDKILPNVNQFLVNDEFSYFKKSKNKSVEAK
ncbi:MAG TPA: hypothetical protein PKN83_26660 [Leptospiraceae bacterium]|nr:hypothetical protein [Leptospiraceae bacterium]HNM92269.1 hypothetical protein [Leptospiraceae bacterium]